MEVSVAVAPELVTVPPEPGTVLVALMTLTAWFLPLRSSVPWFMIRLVVLGVAAPVMTGMVLSTPLLRFTVPALTTKLLLMKYCCFIRFKVPAPAFTIWLVVWM